MGDTPVICRAEEEVLNGCRHGYAWAWRELHRRYRPAAANFLRKLGIAECDLDDCIQDAFLELYRHLAGFRNEAAFKTWFYRICVSQARRARRRVQVAQALRDTSLAMTLHPFVSVPSFTEERALQSIHDASGQLPPSLRVPFVLFEVQGLSGKSIAAILRCPESTVWRRLHVARRAVTEVFLGDGPGS
ncbi:MAG TPA: RNA polymerase sigma factor [Polyangiaceae bacterium]|nr:RNA polymerase sigma factor [Polyangiaceae bacterium]